MHLCTTYIHCIRSGDGQDLASSIFIGVGIDTIGSIYTQIQCIVCTDLEFITKLCTQTYSHIPSVLVLTFLYCIFNNTHQWIVRSNSHTFLYVSSSQGYARHVLFVTSVCRQDELRTSVQEEALRSYHREHNRYLQLYLVVDSMSFVNSYSIVHRTISSILNMNGVFVLGEVLTILHITNAYASHDTQLRRLA